MNARQRDHADACAVADGDGDDGRHARLLSGGGALLGLGTSGPQVSGGLARPALGQTADRTREYVEIVRTVLRREAARASRCCITTFRHPGDDATGLGKPLKLILAPLRADGPDLPCGDRPEERCARSRDRLWLAPIFFLPDRFAEVHRPHSRRASRPGGRPRTGIVAPLVPVVVERRRPACRGPPEAAARALHRRHGSAGPELLQPAGATLRLRGCCDDDPGPVPRRRRARPRSPCPMPSSTRSPSSAIATGSQTASAPGAMRGVTTLILQARQTEALRLLAELTQ